MIRVMVKFKSFPIMIYKTAAAVQKVVRMSTDAVLMCQCFGAEFAVRLRLVQFDDPLLAILETGTIFWFMASMVFAVLRSMVVFIVGFLQIFAKKKDPVGSYVQKVYQRSFCRCCLRCH